MMIGALLLAAATTGDGIFPGKPHVGGLRFFRSHVVSHQVPAGGYGGAWGGHDMGVSGGGYGFGGGGMPGVGGVPGQGGPQRRFVTSTSQVSFTEPAGMTIGWQTGGGQGVEPTYMDGQLSAPARFNFRQGFIYRLKVSNIQGRPNMTLYPSLEIAQSVPATDAYLAHNPVPCQFTEEDFDQVGAGNFVTKVIYLPDPKYQELAISGVETLVSTRLEPGVDPVIEADRRGTILMVIRLGGISLETNAAMTGGANYGGGMPAGAMPPGSGPMVPGMPVGVGAGGAPGYPGQIGGGQPIVSSPAGAAPVANPGQPVNSAPEVAPPANAAPAQPVDPNAGQPATPPASEGAGAAPAPGAGNVPPPADTPPPSAPMPPAVGVSG